MIKLGIVMDPISSINIKKDSSIAMLLEANRRNYVIYYMESTSLYILHGEPFANAKLLSIKEESSNIQYNFIKEISINLSELNVILMRKNPPFNLEFIYITYILELAEKRGTLVVNKPQSLRDCNEKIFTTHFTKYMPDTLVSTSKNQIYNFWEKNKDIIIKPLDNMCGNYIFNIKPHDPNVNVIIEVMTDFGRKFCMIQKYLPFVKENGDKRILIINGEPFPYCLVRFPKDKETRSNLSAGGHGKVMLLNDRDYEISQGISSTLKEKGLIFVGIDVIDGFLTEINVTSPTCIQEIEKESPYSITNILMNTIEDLISHKNIKK